MSWSTQTVANFTPCTDKDGTVEAVLYGVQMNLGCSSVAKNTNLYCTNRYLTEHCPDTCNACPCVNNPEKFTITSGFFKDKKRDCDWAEVNIDSRCNIQDVEDNCPVSCGLCNDTSAPSSKPSQIPSKTPTEPPTYYPEWCQNKNGRFDIESIDWINGRKNCQWAEEQNDAWMKCNIREVQENCPRVCDTCCLDTQESFIIVIRDVRQRKTCNWPANHDTWWRCNNYPELKTNCPVTCGLCNETSEPTARPTARPTSRPTARPTSRPTARPTSRPTSRPTKRTPSTPTERPTAQPTSRPTARPTGRPTARPTKAPTGRPTARPTGRPTAKRATSVPSSMPSMCIDELDWTSAKVGPFASKTCTDIAEKPGFWCGYFSQSSSNGKSADEACCACGGGNHIEIAPSTFPTTTPSTSPTASSSPSGIPTISPSTSPSTSSRPSVYSDSPSSVPSSCTDEPYWFWSETPQYGCAQMSESFCEDFVDLTIGGKNSYLACCVCGGGIHVEISPSMSPSLSSSPSNVHSEIPSTAPSGKPSEAPSIEPSSTPSSTPSMQPSNIHSAAPSISTSPSTVPTARPSISPSDLPSYFPTKVISDVPSSVPSACVDEENWTTSKNILQGVLCEHIAENVVEWCPYFNERSNGKNAEEACCACGGGSHIPMVPTPTPSQGTSYPSIQPSSAPSMMPTEVASSESPSKTPSASPTVSFVPTPIHSASPSAAPSTCEDEPNWIWDAQYNKDCSSLTVSFCNLIETTKMVDGKRASQACCVCGGGKHV